MLNNYEMQGVCLGEGTFSKVLVVRRKNTSEVFALKRFGNNVERSHRRAEITILRNLHHVNIVQFQDADTVDARWIIMEKMDCNLKQFISSNQGFDVLDRHKLKIAKGILLAGVYIQSLGLMHRDIKPENVVVDTKQFVAKIADFGQAQYTACEGRNCAVTTLFYRSPEMCLKANYYDTKVDSWSIGCTLAELFTGSCLFPGIPVDSNYQNITQLCAIYSILHRDSEEKNWTGVSGLPGYSAAEPLLRQLPTAAGLPKQLSGVLRTIILSLLKCDPVQRSFARDALDILPDKFSRLPSSLAQPSPMYTSLASPNGHTDFHGYEYVKEMIDQLKFHQTRDEEDANNNQTACFYRIIENPATLATLWCGDSNKGDSTSDCPLVFVQVYVGSTSAVDVREQQRLSLSLLEHSPKASLKRTSYDGTVVRCEEETLTQTSFILLLHTQRGRAHFQSDVCYGTISQRYDMATYKRQVSALNKILDLSTTDNSLLLHHKLFLGLQCDLGDDTDIKQEINSIFVEYPILLHGLNERQRSVVLSATSTWAIIIRAAGGTGKTKVAVVICMTWMLWEAARQQRAAECETNEENFAAVEPPPAAPNLHGVQKCDLEDLECVDDNVAVKGGVPPKRGKMHVGAFAPTNNACGTMARKIADMLDALQLNSFTVTLVLSAMEAGSRQDQPEYSLANRVQRRIDRAESEEASDSVWNYLRLSKEGDPDFDRETYKEKMAQAEYSVLADSDIICSTLTCAGDRRLVPFVGSFCACAIEEGGRATVPDALCALQLLAPDGRILVSGDSMQLGPFCKHSSLDLLQQSCLERLIQHHEPSSLTEQKRMVPEICDFLSQHLYSGMLSDGTSLPSAPLPSCIAGFSIVWVHTTGIAEKHGTSLTNKAEVERVCDLVRFLHSLNVHYSEVMVSTPYLSQTKAIRSRFKSLRLEEYAPEVCTAEGSQSKEAEINIVSTVTSSTTHSEFFTHLPRQGTLLTRAKKLIIVVGNIELFRNATTSNTLFGLLAAHVVRTNCVFAGDEFPLQEKCFWQRCRTDDSTVPELCLPALFTLFQGDPLVDLRDQIGAFATERIDAGAPVPGDFSDKSTVDGLIDDIPVSGVKASVTGEVYDNASQLGCGEALTSTAAPAPQQSNEVGKKRKISGAADAKVGSVVEEKSVADRSGSSARWVALRRNACQRLTRWQQNKCFPGCARVHLSPTARIGRGLLEKSLDLAMGHIIAALLKSPMLDLFKDGPCRDWVYEERTFPESGR